MDYVYRVGHTDTYGTLKSCGEGGKCFSFSQLSTSWMSQRALINAP